MLTYLIAFSYLLCAFLIYKRQAALDDSSLTNQRWFSLTPAVIATLLHTFVLKNQLYSYEGINLSFFISASLIGWLVSIQIIIASMQRPLESLGLVIFPLTALMALASHFTSNSTIILTHSIGIQSHILLSIIAYSLLMLGTVQALALAFQHHSIKNHHPGGLVKKLPPLHDMESFLFQILALSFAFLSLSLITGFFVFEDLFAQHLIHKTILSIIGWSILLTLLIGHHFFGWRGKTAVNWAVTSFIFVLLAYFGSKFVLEIILKP